jgi:hypothetical protein
MNPTENSHQQPNHILVAVITTAGPFPQHGFDSVPIHQPVKVELLHASKQLGIGNVTGWVATVSGRELNIENSYTDNDLKEKVDISWGPREGGGGRLA